MNTFKYLFRLFRAFPQYVSALFVSTQLEYMVSILLGGYIARGVLNNLNGIEEGSIGIGLALLLLLLSLLFSRLRPGRGHVHLDLRLAARHGSHLPQYHGAHFQAPRRPPLARG